MSTLNFTIRRRIFVLLGGQFEIYNNEGELVGLCQQKAFRLKEDMRVYSDTKKTQETLSIRARSIIDFSAAYDVMDSQTGEKMGALQRKGFSSIFRDSWMVLDEHDQPVGKILEDSALLAFIRRMIGIIPQSFVLRDSSGTELAHFRQNFNPFNFKLKVMIYPNCHLQPMLVVAAGLLLVAVEGHQEA